LAVGERLRQARGALGLTLADVLNFTLDRLYRGIAEE